MSELTVCPHNVPIMGTKQDCLECEIVWYQDCMNDAARRVLSCNEKIRELMIKRSQSNLVAAAPDLLAALKEVVRISDRKHDAWDKARAIIARASGAA